MVVQMQMIYQKRSEDIAARFQARAAELRERVGIEIADRIVDRSPVDSGTYIMAHAAGPDMSGESASRSSQGKPRGRNASQFRELARANLRRSVSAAAVQASGTIWFRNRALHAGRVEYLGWPAPLFGNAGASGRGPYYVYADTRAEVPAIINQVAASMGFDTR